MKTIDNTSAFRCLQTLVSAVTLSSFRKSKYQPALILLGSQYSIDTQIKTIVWTKKDWAEMPITSRTIVGHIYQPRQWIIHES
jgi:hypothetical protein